MFESVENCLMPKIWGYQTICPNESKITGLYKMEFLDRPIYGWVTPNVTSEKKQITQKLNHNQIWGLEEIPGLTEEDIVWVRITENESLWIPKEGYEAYF